MVLIWKFGIEIGIYFSLDGQHQDNIADLLFIFCATFQIYERGPKEYRRSHLRCPSLCHIGRLTDADGIVSHSTSVSRFQQYQCMQKTVNDCAVNRYFSSLTLEWRIFTTRPRHRLYDSYHLVGILFINGHKKA